MLRAASQREDRDRRSCNSLGNIIVEVFLFLSIRFDNPTVNNYEYNNTVAFARLLYIDIDRIEYYSTLALATFGKLAIISGHPAKNVQRMDSYSYCPGCQGRSRRIPLVGFPGFTYGFG
jgi:hypothetical protein